MELCHILLTMSHSAHHILLTTFFSPHSPLSELSLYDIVAAWTN